MAAIAVGVILGGIVGMVTSDAIIGVAVAAAACAVGARLVRVPRTPRKRVPSGR